MVNFNNDVSFVMWIAVSIDGNDEINNAILNTRKR